MKSAKICLYYKQYGKIPDGPRPVMISIMVVIKVNYHKNVPESFEAITFAINYLPMSHLR